MISLFAPHYKKLLNQLRLLEKEMLAPTVRKSIMSISKQIWQFKITLFVWPIFLKWLSNCIYRYISSIGSIGSISLNDLSKNSSINIW